MMMRSFHLILLIVLLLLGDRLLVNGSDIPIFVEEEEEGDAVGSEAQPITKEDVSLLPKIPVLSDAIAVLHDTDDDSDNCGTELVNDTTSIDITTTTATKEDDESENDQVEEKSKLIPSREEDDDDDDDDDGLIQMNPNYDETESEVDDNSRVDKVSSSSSSNCTKDSDDTKSMIAQVLNGRRYNKIRKFVKHHRMKITIVLVIIAFRQEIRTLIWNRLLSKPIYDPKTNQIIGRTYQSPNILHPTSILKILLFIHAVRRIQQLSNGGGDPNNSSSSDQQQQQQQQQRSPIITPIIFLLTGQFSSLVAWMMSDLLLSSSNSNNPAYIPPIQQHYTFERMNYRYQKDIQAYHKAKLMEHELKGGGSSAAIKLKQLLVLAQHRQVPNMTNVERGTLLYDEKLVEERLAKKMSSNTVTLTSYNSTIVIMDWTELDSSLSKLDTLRDEVSFLIHCYDQQKQQQHHHHVTKVDDDDTKKDPTTAASSSATTIMESLSSSSIKNNNNNNNNDPFEVVVLLESPGGSASEYALAAQQILRLRQNGISVTICVDKVAASGGYMIACTSTPGQLYAAPFAVLGSIGVIGQSINIHKLLEGFGITPLVFRGGKDKAPVGLIGEVTRTGMNKVQTMVDDTHRAFKRHVAESRPCIANRINEIATGDIWLGYDALHVGLIDRIVTSDEYISERIRNGARILKLLKIVRGRSLFSKPQTEVLSQLLSSNNTPQQQYDYYQSGSSTTTSMLLDIISTCRSFLDKAQQSAMGALLTGNNNLSPATRTPSLLRQEPVSFS